MKNVLLTLALAIFGIFALTGCLSPTQSTIREYDTAGQLVKETQTSESVVKTVIESTKDKLVMVNDQSWLGGVRFVPPGSSTENPMGTLEALVGKKDFIMLTAPQEPVSDIAAATVGYESMIRAARAGEISVGSSGISATTPEVEPSAKEAGGTSGTVVASK